jgi:hypothetical protein
MSKRKLSDAQIAEIKRRLLRALGVLAVAALPRQRVRRVALFDLRLRW